MNAQKRSILGLDEETIGYTYNSNPYFLLSYYISGKFFFVFKISDITGPND